MTPDPHITAGGRLCSSTFLNAGIVDGSQCRSLPSNPPVTSYQSSQARGRGILRVAVRLHLHPLAQGEHNKCNQSNYRDKPKPLRACHCCRPYERSTTPLPHRKSGLPELRIIMRNRGKPRLRGGGSRPSLPHLLLSNDRNALKFTITFGRLWSLCFNAASRFWGHGKAPQLNAACALISRCLLTPHRNCFVLALQRLPSLDGTAREKVQGFECSTKEACSRVL